ncbi:MAG: hypothetical protein Q7S89_00250 [bacterium]|nr:hypothetical protein [bacterium]
MAAVAVLERTALTPSDAERWGTLPDRADRQLGYTPMRRKRDRRRLANALARLNIQPFTNESVVEYKRSLGPNAKITLGAWLKTIGITGVFCCLTMMTFSLTSGPVAFFGLCASMFMLCTGIIFSDAGNKWTVTALNKYRRAVPQDVLETALSVQGELPKVTVFVHAFNRDPFLAVHYGKEMFFIAKWDEPSFKPTTA